MFRSSSFCSGFQLLISRAGFFLFTFHVKNKKKAVLSTQCSCSMRAVSEGALLASLKHQQPAGVPPSAQQSSLTDR